MEKMVLQSNGWKMQIVGENAYGITQEEMVCNKHDTDPRAKSGPQ